MATATTLNPEPHTDTLAHPDSVTPEVPQTPTTTVPATPAGPRGPDKLTDEERTAVIRSINGRAHEALSSEEADLAAIAKKDPQVDLGLRMANFILHEEKLPWDRTWLKRDNLPVSISTSPDKSTARFDNSGYDKSFSGSNLLIAYMDQISNQRGDPRYLTGKTIFDQLGGHVNEGEKALYLLRPKLISARKLKDGEKESEAAGRQPDDNGKVLVGFRYYPVFNVEQTNAVEDGLIPPLEPAQMRHDAGSIARFDQMIDGYQAANGGAPGLVHKGSQPCYVPATDQIIMPDKGDFESDSAYYHVLGHEAAHSTGHKSRLNRDFKGMGDHHSYSVEELRAESAAAFMALEMGLPDNDRHEQLSMAYLQSWAEGLKNSPKESVQAIGQGKRIADYLMQWDPGCEPGR